MPRRTRLQSKGLEGATMRTVHPGRRGGGLNTRRILSDGARRRARYWPARGQPGLESRGRRRAGTPRAMDPSRALARLSDVTAQGLPMAQRLLRRARERVDEARQRLDEAAHRMLGHDFQE